MRVLLVEDSRTLLKLCEMTILEAGHEVDSCRNGWEAWQRLLKKWYKFHLVISDNNMPLMSGVELLRRMRADSLMVNLPFVLVSGGTITSQDDPTPLAETCARYGARFLLKPFEYDRFLSFLV